MNKRNLITRISNELGNQMFMYASTLGISMKIKKTLLLDNESAYLSHKNISKYGLNNFKITSKIAPDNLKFLGTSGYFKRKFFKKIDALSFNKNFYIEKKNKDKLTEYNNDFINKNFANNVFFEGYFETQNYFTEIKNIILNEFNFIDNNKYIESPFFNELNKCNSISICLRQNRFSEGKGKIDNINNLKNSDTFTKEQIIYINKSINFFKSKIDNPIFYLWSNNSTIDLSLFNEKVKVINHNKIFYSDIDKRCLDLFLISICKHHIVIPSSFNWWGAWLSQNTNKIILRPSNKFFSLFKVNNKDLWPSEWIEID